jgi:hypothetical protein
MNKIEETRKNNIMEKEIKDLNDPLKKTIKFEEEKGFGTEI